MEMSAPEDYATLRDRHLESMQDWLEGRRSWINYGPNEPYTPAVIAVMDTQEVIKHAAAAQAYGVLAAAHNDGLSAR